MSIVGNPMTCDYLRMGSTLAACPENSEVCLWTSVSRRRALGASLQLPLTLSGRSRSGDFGKMDMEGTP